MIRINWPEELSWGSRLSDRIVQCRPPVGCVWNKTGSARDVPKKISVHKCVQKCNVHSYAYMFKDCRTKTPLIKIQEMPNYYYKKSETVHSVQVF